MIDKNKVGMSLALLSGAIHAFWSLLVAIGWAKPAADFIHGLHFVHVEYSLLDFNFWRAALLVLVASLIGYAVGWMFGHFWNRVHK